MASLAWTRPELKIAVILALSDYNINLYIAVAFEKLMKDLTIA